MPFIARSVRQGHYLVSMSWVQMGARCVLAAMYLFSQLFSNLLHFLPSSHRVSTPRCVEENQRYLRHTPEALHLEKNCY